METIKAVLAFIALCILAVLGLVVELFLGDDE